MKILTASILVFAVCLKAHGADALRIAEFAGQEDLRWQLVNDTVMGGKSTSDFSVSEGRLRFSGYLNTDGGGFTSLRAAPQPWDLSAHTVIRLRVRGDGRTYQVRLHASGSRIAYKASFPTEAGQWQTLEFAFADFQATWRGRELNEPPPEPAAINSVGLLLADGKYGAFQIDVDWIEFASGMASAKH